VALETLGNLIKAADTLQVQQMCDAGIGDALQQMLSRPWRNPADVNMLAAWASEQLRTRQDTHSSAMQQNNRGSSSAGAGGSLDGAGGEQVKLPSLNNTALSSRGVDYPGAAAALWLLVQAAWYGLMGVVSRAAGHSGLGHVRAGAVHMWCAAEALLLPMLSMSLLVKLLCLALVRLWCRQVLLLDSGLSLWGELLRLLSWWLLVGAVAKGQSWLQVAGTACYAWACLSMYK
jgi:hypothetical protein